MERSYFSSRTGLNPNAAGFPLADVVEAFVRVFDRMCEDGFFDQAFGEHHDINSVGELRDVGFEIFKAVRKKNLWPISEHHKTYREDDLFDIIEFFYQHVSVAERHTLPHQRWKIVEVTFDRAAGQRHYRKSVNEILDLYVDRFELSPSGHVLRKTEAGFEPMFSAALLTSDIEIKERVEAAVLQFRRHHATPHERRHAVVELAGILESLRPAMKNLVASKDEGDLFNIANNFGLRHQNAQQKTNYDPLWLNWIFYVYLATIHLILRKTDRQKS